MKVNFINIDNTVIDYSPMVWIIKEDTPSKPLIRISYDDFTLINNGHFRSQKNIVILSNKKYYFPQEIFDNIKDIKEDMVFSFREWLNPDLSNNPLKFNSDWLVDKFKKTTDIIYFVTELSSDNQIINLVNQLIDELEMQGVVVNKLFHLSKTSLNQSDDIMALKLIRILMESLIGRDIKNYEITEKKVREFDLVEYIDTDKTVLHKLNNITGDFISILEEKNKIDLSNKLDNKELFLQLKTSNTLRPFRKFKIDLERSSFIDKYSNINEAIYLGKIELKDYNLKINPYAHSAFFKIEDKKENIYEFEVKPQGDYNEKKDLIEQEFKSFRIFFPSARDINSDKFSELVDKLVYIINKNKLGYKVDVSKRELSPKYGLLPFIDIDINIAINLFDFERLISSTKAITYMVKKEKDPKKGLDSPYF